MVVNGDMSAFVGNLTVSSGSMTIAGGIGEYDLAVQEAVNNLVKDGNAPSDSGVATTVTVADQAALTVGNLTVTKALAVNANGDFTAGNITVAKTTYKDLKVSTGEEAMASALLVLRPLLLPRPQRPVTSRLMPVRSQSLVLVL